MNNNRVRVYIEESICKGVSKILMHYSVTYAVQTYITHRVNGGFSIHNYYNIPQTMSMECFEIINNKFNKAKITSFLEAIMFVEEVINPYILMEKIVG